MAPTELPRSPDCSSWPGRAPPVQPARCLTASSLPGVALAFPLFSALLRALCPWESCLEEEAMSSLCQEWEGGVEIWVS